ncbi:hypothetical protein D3C85_627110 [compost metagenome]
MRSKILIALTILVLYSCQNKEKPASKNIIKTIAQDILKIRRLYWFKINLRI